MRDVETRGIIAAAGKIPPNGEVNVSDASGRGDDFAIDPHEQYLLNSDSFFKAGRHQHEFKKNCLLFQIKLILALL